MLQIPSFGNKFILVSVIQIPYCHKDIENQFIFCDSFSEWLSLPESLFNHMLFLGSEIGPLASLSVAKTFLLVSESINGLNPGWACYIQLVDRFSICKSRFYQLIYCILNTKKGLHSAAEWTCLRKISNADGKASYLVNVGSIFRILVHVC